MPTSLIFLICVAGADAGSERFTYLRPAGDRFASECRFEIQKQKDGWSIASTTERPKAVMRVSARYDGGNRLLSAEAVLEEGDKKMTAAVEVANDKATVRRPGQPAQEFDVSPGVIVTSAPDWSDTFLLARGYDRKKGGKQEFPGLWIHPSQPTQVLRFSIEKVGSDTIVHEGKKIELDRCEIRIRGNSGYAAWIDATGRLIRLLPLTAKEGGMVLEGFEQSAARLKPQ